jgi:methylglyoxal synthase
MEHDVICMAQRKRIALVAHDNKKQDLLEWARYNRSLLVEHELYATGTTGNLLEAVLEAPIHKLQSGPLGGDQQIGAKITEGSVDFMIFFWDPLEPQPHDTDVKALLRIAVVWNIPVACDRASADFMISSSLMSAPYERLVPVYSGYRERVVAGMGQAVSDEASPVAQSGMTDAAVTSANTPAGDAPLISSMPTTPDPAD